MTHPIEYREVNRPPVVGDLIKITSERFSHEFDVGQICRVISTQSASIVAASLDETESWYVREACFVVVEAVTFVRAEERPRRHHISMQRVYRATYCAPSDREVSVVGGGIHV